MKHETKPILKWVGGKKQLYSEIEKRIPDKINSYHEPFLGGGFVFFSLRPKNAYLNDLNFELINVYLTIRDNHEELIKLLKKYKNTREFFYKMRSLDRDEKIYSKLSNAEKAARIIYLNKTCFNGLYRVNSFGQLNSPFGFYKNPVICDEIMIKKISDFLNSNDIVFSTTDFSDLITNVRKNDFVYLDPPYDPVSASSSFTGYCANGFDRDDQVRLKNLCDKIDKKGAKFLLSNSDTLFIRNLYAEYKIETVYANRCINSKTDSRNKIKELMIRNYE